MKRFDKYAEKLEIDFSLTNLVKIVLILLVILLIQSTEMVWMGILKKLYSIIRPFWMGFLIAYVMRGLILELEKRKVSRKVSVAILYVTAILIIIGFLSILIPMLINHAGELINALISSITWLYTTMLKAMESEVPGWVRSLFTEITSALSNMKNLIPEFGTSIPGTINSFLGQFTNFIFAGAISMYLCFSWEKLVGLFLKVMIAVRPAYIKKLYHANDEVRNYLKSLIILMGIKFIEYSLVYFFVGNKEWMILALLTALSLIVPYLGPIVANVVGIFASLTLSPVRIAILLVLIAVLSNVDAYLIDPMVRSKVTDMSPLLALFSIYAGGQLLGTTGVILAIPVYLIIRSFVKGEDPEKKEPDPDKPEDKPAEEQKAEVTA